MKKNILLAVTLLAIITTTNAQSLHVGLKIGANFDKVQGESFNQGYNAGFLGGAFVDIGLGKFIGVSGEVLFNQTDTKYETGSPNQITLQQAGNVLSDGSNIKLNYLTIPVLLDIKAAKILTFQLGPQYGILMNSNETVLQNGQNAFTSGNFAIVLGARVNLGALRVYGRYNIGLSNISDAPDSDKWTSQQIQVGLGFTIL